MKRRRREFVPVGEADLAHAFRVIRAALRRRTVKHGQDAYVSPHHALGVLVEEYDEAVEAIRFDADPHRFDDELVDVAVTCLWALASSRARERAP